MTLLNSVLILGGLLGSFSRSGAANLLASGSNGFRFPTLKRVDLTGIKRKFSTRKSRKRLGQEAPPPPTLPPLMNEDQLIFSNDVVAPSPPMMLASMVNSKPTSIYQDYMIHDLPNLHPRSASSPFVLNHQRRTDQETGTTTSSSSLPSTSTTTTTTTPVTPIINGKVNSKPLDSGHRKCAHVFHCRRGGGAEETVAVAKHHSKSLTTSSSSTAHKSKLNPADKLALR